MRQISRRTLLKILGGAGLAAGSCPSWLLAKPRPAIKKPIPVSGEKLAVIGMGSSRTFDVSEAQAVSALLPVLQAFFDEGGALIDSSPMYGNAEQVLGDLLQKVDNKQALFAATKVWIEGKQQGIEQMQRSMQRMAVKRFDLMQIHNLRDWQVHLETLNSWKNEGRIRYTGITTSHGRFHDQLQAILQTEPLDFVQFSYNIA
ncbi:MAG: aldo/keto reductase, partial [Thiogranum sp.]